MKIKREQLKAIVKECLVELLQEGLGGALVAAALPENYNRNRDLEPLPGQARSASRGAVDPAAVRRRTMDLTEHRPTPSPVIHEAQRQRVAPQMNSVIANAAPNPMMAAIFADTAATTFAAQESPTSTVGGDAATRAAAAMNPMDMFGEDKIDTWNRAAFAPSQPGVLQSPLALALLKGG